MSQMLTVPTTSRQRIAPVNPALVSSVRSRDPRLTRQAAGIATPPQLLALPNQPVQFMVAGPASALPKFRNTNGSRARVARLPAEFAEKTASSGASASATKERKQSKGRSHKTPSSRSGGSSVPKTKSSLLSKGSSSKSRSSRSSSSRSSGAKEWMESSKSPRKSAPNQAHPRFRR